MSYKVLIPMDITEAGKKYLRDKGYEIKMGSGNEEDSIIKDLPGCDAILSRTEKLTRRVLEAARDIKVIGKHGVGVDNIDIQTAEELGIWVTNSPLSNSTAVAEHTMCLILAAAKNLVIIDRAMRDADYPIRNRIKGVDLEGKTIGIIGLGRIGTMVAKKAVCGFGMKVIGYDSYLSEDEVAPEIDYVKDMNDVFKKADFITLHIPATETTKAMIGKAQFELMKPTAYFLNCARGEVVVEEDLYQILKDKKIAGAAVDVYSPEPPTKDNPLLALENIILTPHNASLTYETTDRMGVHAAMGIDEVLSGKIPSWPVAKPINSRAKVK